MDEWKRQHDAHQLSVRGQGLIVSRSFNANEPQELPWSHDMSWLRGRNCARFAWQLQRQVDESNRPNLHAAVLCYLATKDDKVMEWVSFFLVLNAQILRSQNGYPSPGGFPFNIIEEWQHLESGLRGNSFLQADRHCTHKYWKCPVIATIHVTPSKTWFVCMPKWWLFFAIAFLVWWLMLRQYLHLQIWKSLEHCLQT